MSVLVDGRKNGYEVVSGGYRTKYIPIDDGQVSDVELYKLPKRTFVESIIGVNDTDKEVKVKIGGSNYTLDIGDSIVDVKKSFKTEEVVSISSDATEGECVFVVQTIEYDRVQGTRTSLRI